MGDKGGKKDKEKNKQQRLTKQKQEGAKEAGQGPAKDSLAGSSSTGGGRRQSLRRSRFTRDHEFGWETILGATGQSEGFQTHAAGQPIAR